MPQTEVRKLLADYLSYLEIEKNRSPKTRENYEHYLNVFLEFAKIKTPARSRISLVREFRMNLAARRGAAIKKDHAKLLRHRA